MRTTKGKDFGGLLTAFPDRKSRPTATAVRGSVRLPSLARLLEIDAQAEHAAMLARMSVDASNVVKATENTNSVADAGDERIESRQHTAPGG